MASPPIATLIRLTNTPSDNFFAEMLLKDLGARFGAGGTTAAVQRVVKSVIAEQLGLQPGARRRLRAVALSTAVRRPRSSRCSSRCSPTARSSSSLAVAGVSGTMEQEMLGTRAVDNCRGKTGTLQQRRQPRRLLHGSQR